MPDPWFHLDSGSGEPAQNMALDEALLHCAATTGAPVLRFYSWTAPAATFGYFQAYKEIAGSTQARPLIRRPTGGGLVPHVNDWTYSLTVPPGHFWYDLPAALSYERIHRWLQATFRELGVATGLAPCCRKEIAGQCFAGHEKSDLLFAGRKLAGAAQRRNRLGLLIQGSIQPPPPGVKREWFIAMMVEAGREFLGANTTRLETVAAVAALAARLREERYSRDEYNQRR